MTTFYTITVDKFIFKVATDRFYTTEGVWASVEGTSVRVGLSDYLQRRSGDVAFVEVKPVGILLNSGDEVASLETIKVNISLASPVSGKLTKGNQALESAPELINTDPYGDGWLAVVEAVKWETDRAHLLSAEHYFELIKQQAEQDVSKP